MSKERRRILQPKRLLVWRAMLKEANYPDTDVVDDTIKGTDLVGEAPATAIFNIKFRPAKRTVEDLVSCAPAVREAIIQSVRSQGQDVDAEVLRQRQAEVDKGWATGPIDVKHLPPNSLVSRRFGLVQPNKTRLIDDLSASGINDTVQAEETPTGRQFRIFLNTLTDYAYGDHPPLLPPMCITALENFTWMLENAGPRTVSVDGQKPMYIFTDACYNPHDDWVCGIGGMLFNHKGQLLAGFSHRLEACERAQLGEGSSDTIIMAAEFVAVSCAILAWQGRLRNVPLVLFIDNNACRDVLISAKGRSPLMRKLLAHYLKNEHKVVYTPWVARVPSPSNCSDAPSRRKFAHLTWKNQSVACTDVKAALEAVLECLQTETVKLG